MTMTITPKDPVPPRENGVLCVVKGCAAFREEEIDPMVSQNEMASRKHLADSLRFRIGMSKASGRGDRRKIEPDGGE